MQSVTTYSISAWAAPPVACDGCCTCNHLKYNGLITPPRVKAGIIYKIYRAIVRHSNVPCGSALFLPSGLWH